MVGTAAILKIISVTPSDVQIQLKWKHFWGNHKWMPPLVVNHFQNNLCCKGWQPLASLVDYIMESWSHDFEISLLQCHCLLWIFIQSSMYLGSSLVGPTKNLPFWKILGEIILPATLHKEKVITVTNKSIRFFAKGVWSIYTGPLVNVAR